MDNFSWERRGLNVETETTTPQQLKPGIAKVTNPEEYVETGERGVKFC